MGHGFARKLMAAAMLAVWTASGATAGCSDDAVDLRGPWGQARFSVELATTNATRSKGLMFREKLAASAGMLFLYDRPQRVSFWMKNTLIPLDLIFFDVSGVATRVHARAQPHDLTNIEGGNNVVAVLEINGGLAGRLGIGPGTALRHPQLDQEKAVWPCDGE